MPPPPNSDTAEKEAPAEAIDLQGRYELLPSTPLPQLDCHGGKAYLARGVRDRRIEPFVIICKADAMSRMEIMMLVRNIENSGLMRMLDIGVVPWPDGSRRLAVVFEKPGGRRLMNQVNDAIEPMAEEFLTRLLIQPAHSALVELSGRGVTHGSVRPTNLFFRDVTSSGMVLGECVTSPIGFTQPVLFETIERGMTLPAGRGLGTVSDDLYALGVTILILLLGRNPVRNLDDETLITAKIERGTYPALVGQMRLPASITEPLRGLLADDPKQRWTLNDLDLWLNGRRLSPKQPQVPRRAIRPFEFNAQEFLHCRTLSRAFGRNPTAAALAIDSGEIDRWLKRSMSDELRAEAVNGAIETASAAGKGAGLADRLVSRVCMALDPPAPIRYKTKATMPDGIGVALAEALFGNHSTQALAEIIQGQLPMFWVNVQMDFRAEFVPLVHSFDVMRSYLEISSSGFGIERVLYELNPGMPCISPLVDQQYPLNPPELLKALDVAARRSDRPREPMDRHIAAFLCSRNRRFDEMWLAHIAPGGDPIRRSIALLNIMSETQRKYSGEVVPSLCEWMVSLLEPAINRFKNRPTRARIRKEVDAAAREGRLVELVRLVDDADSVRQDQISFDAAVREYQTAAKEIDRLSRTVRAREEIARTLGRQTAAIASSVVGSVMMAGLVVFYWVL